MFRTMRFRLLPSQRGGLLPGSLRLTLRPVLFLLGLTSACLLALPRIDHAARVKPVPAFPGAGAGEMPVFGVIEAKDGNLYGTTSRGGTSAAGTVYKITTGGALTTLYSFKGTAADGAAPTMLLQGKDGNLYGVTRQGQTRGTAGGTVFKITTDGSLTTLHAFATTDGSSPDCLLQARDGNLYGTAGEGGSGSGTAFKVSTSGVFTVLHTFGGIRVDGGRPTGLIQAKDGHLYGTTATTVFKMTTGGNLTTLYTFTGDFPPSPYGKLLQASDGNFYGITFGLGSGLNSYGTVFKMTKDGTLTTLHTFTTAKTDGSNPYGCLIEAGDGNLYSTTSTGGAHNYGTVYKITTGGAFTLLYSFKGTTSDGGNPTCALMQAKDGNLYGTTLGGISQAGNPNGATLMGTVFKITTEGKHKTLYSFD